jgi:hypothetical protein
VLALKTKMKMKKVYYRKDKYGNNRYENLTQQDRIKLRDCKNRGRALTSSEKKEIFGSENPIFERRY